MDLGISGKTALVLGGSGGLGSAIARTLAAEGARVVVAGRSREKVDAVVSDIQASGYRAASAIWSLDDPVAMDARIAAIETEFGGVDILINNTGGPPPSLVAGQDAQLWAQQFQTMVLSVIGLTDRVLPHMRGCGWGRVITSTSSGVIAPIPNLGLSNALRATLVGWSKTLAGEVARDGITTNIVVPGRIATSRIAFLDEQRAKRTGRPLDDIAAESAASVPVGRYGDPQEYADVVAFLASVRASFVTGSVVRVDGGMIANV